MLGDEGALHKRATEGRPYGSDKEGGQKDDADDEHDEVFHQAVIKERFLVAGFKNKIDGSDQVGKQEAGADKGTDEPEPSQIGEIVRDFLRALKKCGIQPDKEFIGKDVQAAKSQFRAADDFCRDKGENGSQGDGAEKGEIRDLDGELTAPVFVESLEG